MISVGYRVPRVEATLFVQQDERLLVRPLRERGPIPLGRGFAEHSWRRVNRRETLRKAARGGCLAVNSESTDPFLAAGGQLLDRQTLYGVELSHTEYQALLEADA